ATEALNKLAQRIPFAPGDVVITTTMEHHSNDLPWRARAQVEHAGLQADGSLDVADLAARLERHAGRVRLVTVTGASNVTGYTPPVHEIAELAHRHGALIAVDCAQLAPHRAIHMGPPGSPQHLDFVALSAHKIYAPFGAGALVGPRAFFAQGAPDYRGGGTIEIVTLDEVHWADPPDRDEAGTPNVVGAVALAASLRVLSRVGMDAVAAHEAELTRYALHRLQALPEVHIAGSADAERTHDRLGVISFSVEGVPHALVAAVLGFEGGISVRSGCFCAHPYVVRLLGIGDAEFQAHQRRALQHDRSTLPGLVRASLGCYNTSDDVDHLVDMLARIIARDYRGDYVIDRTSGMYLPRGWDGIREA
ncbi:MAG TPA: aminotransferase class V-fold PLP-dependent enzyme, partial [Anaerolineae bacterium]|nr:aminotransferase class V-fold PLP-dependent enzyme [Anaerolineae bacterium]